MLWLWNVVRYGLRVDHILIQILIIHNSVPLHHAPSATFSCCSHNQQNLVFYDRIWIKTNKQTSGCDMNEFNNLHPSYGHVLDATLEDRILTMCRHWWVHVWCVIHILTGRLSELWKNSKHPAEVPSSKFLLLPVFSVEHEKCMLTEHTKLATVCLSVQRRTGNDVGRRSSSNRLLTIQYFYIPPVYTCLELLHKFKFRSRDKLSISDSFWHFLLHWHEW